MFPTVLPVPVSKALSKLLMACLVAVPMSVLAQTTKTTTIVVPYPARGTIGANLVAHIKKNPGRLNLPSFCQLSMRNMAR